MLWALDYKFLIFKFNMYSVSFTAELLFCSHYTAKCFDLSCHHQAIYTVFALVISSPPLPYFAHPNF